MTSEPLDPETIEDLPELVWDLLEEEQHREALALLRRARKDRPEDPEVLCLFSECYLDLKKYRRARRFADRAVATGADQGWGRRLRTEIFTRQGKRKAALQAARAAVEAGLSSATLEDLAEAELRCREFEAAARTAEQLRALAPDLPLPYETLAAVANERRQWREAETHAREALFRDPDSHRGMRDLGLALLRQENPEEAARWFEEAEARYPAAAQARAGIQDAVGKYFSVGVLAALLGVAKTASKHGPRYAALGGLGFLVYLGLVLLWRRRQHQALPAALRAAVHHQRRRARPQAIRDALYGISIIFSPFWPGWIICWWADPFTFRPESPVSQGIFLLLGLWFWTTVIWTIRRYARRSPSQGAKAD